MKTKPQVMLICLFVLTICPTTSVWAFKKGDTTIFVVGGLGVEGKANIELETQKKTKIKENFKTTFGVGAWADYALSDNFAIGGGLGLLWWTGENMHNQGIGRSNFVEFGPSARFGVEPIQKVTFYIRLASGACLLILDNEYKGSLSESLGTDIYIDPALGFSASVYSGVNIEFSERVGLVFEIGYAHHIINNGSMTENSKESDYSLNGGQLRFNVGLSF